jgi:hypothetical protein
MGHCVRGGTGCLLESAGSRHYKGVLSGSTPRASLAAAPLQAHACDGARLVMGTKFKSSLS